jgi:hypothetical protein
VVDSSFQFDEVKGLSLWLALALAKGYFTARQYRICNTDAPIMLDSVDVQEDMALSKAAVVAISQTTLL